MTNDNHKSTTDSNLGEQAFESKVAESAAFIETMFDSSEASAHRWISGQIGSGITHPPTEDDAFTGGDEQ